MGVAWTDEQKRIIDQRNGNLLVAAAAGSGKTAVLVERIVKMITDPEHPVSIESLLVVTFTKAAAAQMRERIGKRLAELREEAPEDENLRCQEDLLPHAKITTIDSFCLYVVKNYFNFLDLDPDFRVADDDELKLVREQVLKELLEEKYEEADEAFLAFADAYRGKKSDRELLELMEKLYKNADAFPVPSEQLDLWEKEIDGTNTPLWQERLAEWCQLYAKDMCMIYDKAIELSLEDGAPIDFDLMFRSDKAAVERLLEVQNYRDLYAVINFLLHENGFMRMPTKGKNKTDPEKREQLSALRNTMKKQIQYKMKRLELGDPEQVEADIAGCRNPLLELIALVREYTVRYEAAKKEKNAYSFSDIEHFALQILTEPGDEPGKRVPSEVAGLLRDHFEEIMIDEYQDSSRVQEEILTAISRESEGRPNIFMVGDVKQSIYKFRQARPELFMEKYASYDQLDEHYEKIDLHNNFRSAREVLDSVNFLFSQYMIPSVGGITYDDAAALVHGRKIPEAEEGSGISHDTEIYFMNTKSSDEGEDISAIEDLEGKEMEARMIISRIRELTDPETGFRFYDNETEQYRLCEYRDIVILLRSMKGFAEVFVDELLAADIPAFAQTRTGYFDAMEVQVVLNLLRVIDNPMQDIPLASVLHSSIGRFSAEELAKIVASLKQNLESRETNGLYGALLLASESCEEEELKGKCTGFLELLRALRERATYEPLHKLIRSCLEKTGYGFVISAMPGGSIRSANIEMLIQRAMDFEATGSRSLFRFIHYIENIQKFEIDFGEAAAAGEQDNSVRINTIHKSKGLEYPVVILAGCGKKFNTMEARGRVLFHADLGITADHVDTEARTYAATLPKKVFADQLNLETAGEELRILYVAMTRAREKLILTGTGSSLESKWGKWTGLSILKSLPLPFFAVSSADSYMDWILMGLSRSRVYREIYEKQGQEPPVFHPVYQLTPPIVLHEEGKETLIFAETLKKIKEEQGRRELESLAKEAPGEEILSQMEFHYAYEAAVDAPRKFSVSRLKKAAIEKHEAEGYGISDTISDEHYDQSGEGGAEDQTPVSYIEKGEMAERKLPAFLSGEKEASGADRGTAYHHLLELMSFDIAPEVTAVKAEEERLIRAGLLSEEETKLISLRKIAVFLNSELGQRMKKAQKNGVLSKEKQFVMGIPGEEIGEGLSEEKILIQGIVDAWFEEQGEIILMDYKTDRVDPIHGEMILKKRYEVQLELYRKALEQAFGKHVKEIWIYSFSLEKQILL